MGKKARTIGLGILVIGLIILGAACTRQDTECLANIARRLRGKMEGLSGIQNHWQGLLPGLEPERADVILAGAAIALAVMEKSRCESLWVSDQGIRYGALYERLQTKSAPR